MRIGQLVPQKPFNITTPNNEQLWACLQRCLTFEDPTSRWARLQNLVRKHVEDDALKVRDFASLPLAYQDQVFAQIYGIDGLFDEVADEDAQLGQPTTIALLNILLALEDIERFTEIAFESWKVAVPADINDKSLVRLFLRRADSPLVSELAKHLSLSAAQELWLQHCFRAVPDWSLMLRPGPWTNDERTLFLSEQMEKLEKVAPTVEGYLKARESFRSALKANRSELPGSFLPNLIVIVEGETESILLPHFARLLGADFSDLGVMLVSAGGGKQVARKYFEMRDVVALPMVMFADADAGEEVEVVQESLRDNDRLHVWKEGEIEDTLDINVLIQQLNALLQTSDAPGFVSINEFAPGQRRTAILNRIFRSRGLGNFDKIGFAETVAANVNDKNHVPRPVAEAIKTIQELLQSKVS